MTWKYSRKQWWDKYGETFMDDERDAFFAKSPQKPKSHTPGNCPLRGRNDGTFGCTECMPTPTTEKPNNQPTNVRSEEVKPNKESTPPVSEDKKEKYYESACCHAKVFDHKLGTMSRLECTKCHRPCSLTLTKAGIEASVASSHSLSYPTPPVDRISETKTVEGKIGGECLNCRVSSVDLTNRQEPVKKIDKVITNPLSAEYVSHFRIIDTLNQAIDTLNAHSELLGGK